MILMNLFAGRNRDEDRENRALCSLMTQRDGMWGGGREAHMYISIYS